MKESTFFSSIAILVIGLGSLGMWGCPQYKVYSQTMQGRADFSEAEVNRQIAVEEARAQEEALMMVANGEAEREKIKADAAAYAIGVIREELDQTDQGYLYWLWITEGLQKGDRVYIPTESALPILERK